jgi:hypothetical protein
MSQSETEYLLVRAAQERAKAAEAANELVQEFHERLARHYEVRANISAVVGKADNDVLGVTSGEPPWPGRR